MCFAGRAVIIVNEEGKMVGPVALVVKKHKRANTEIRRFAPTEICDFPSIFLTPDPRPLNPDPSFVIIPFSLHLCYHGPDLLTKTLKRPKGCEHAE